MFCEKFIKILEITIKFFVHYADIYSERVIRELNVEIHYRYKKIIESEELNGIKDYYIRCY
jgi:hypothetical protein